MDNSTLGAENRPEISYLYKLVDLSFYICRMGLFKKWGNTFSTSHASIKERGNCQLVKGTLFKSPCPSLLPPQGRKNHLTNLVIELSASSSSPLLSTSAYMLGSILSCPCGFPTGGHMWLGVKYEATCWRLPWEPCPFIQLKDWNFGLNLFSSLVPHCGCKENVLYSTTNLSRPT